jgi:hypothetical protein
MVKEQTINAILHFLENVAPIGDTKRFFSCFDNALVLDKSLQNYDEDFCFLDVHPVRDLAFKIDYSQVFWNDKDQNYSFNRVKTINPKTVRGKYKVYTPHMLQWDGGILETNNKTYYHSTLVSWINNQ